ncbi:MAG: DUF805 domain-containing protein [Verrucomicrobia bacterium]|nr:DUF805 domain-containing protein [Verrucomicrobiota bacterium]
MNPISAYIDALSKYFDYYGTVSRREYWMFMITAVIIFVIMIGVGLGVSLLINEVWGLENHGGLYNRNHGGYQLNSQALIVLVIYLAGLLFAIVLPGLALMARRLNDMGWSRWWLLLIVALLSPIPNPLHIIPGHSMIPIIVLGCIPSRND